MHVDKRGVQLELCATPSPPFQRQHLRRWLYASIELILKTVKITGGVECWCAWKTRDSRRISGRCWMPTPDHHLDDRLSLSHVNYTTTNKRYPLMNGTATHEWTIVLWRKSPKLRRRQIVQKTICPPPLHPAIWKSLKRWPPNLKKPTDRTELYHRANFYADRREISFPGQKIHIFPCRGLPWGATLPCYFWKALVEPMLRSTWHITLRLTVFEIFAVKIWDFGGPWGPLGYL